MRVVGIYSLKNGAKEIVEDYESEYRQVLHAVRSVRADEHQTKISREKTMPGRTLYNPRSLNDAFKAELVPDGWESRKVPAKYSTDHYIRGYSPPAIKGTPHREMDFVKNRLGLEIQFGKYAFMVYNVCAKMTIFHNLGHIDAGIEIVPVKAFAANMSTGVSYFEQFVWDLENRGVADIDIPVLILGIDQ